MRSQPYVGLRRFSVPATAEDIGEGASPQKTADLVLCTTDVGLNRSVRDSKGGKMEMNLYRRLDLPYISPHSDFISLFGIVVSTTIKLHII